MSTKTTYEPTAKELEMLNYYHDLVGFRWKAALLKLWYVEKIGPVAFAPQIRSLRTAANEVWLRKFSLENANKKATAEKPPVVVTFQITCAGDAFLDGGISQILSLFNAASKRLSEFSDVRSLDGHEGKLSDLNGNICATLTAKLVENETV
jgi:hypothetical protein